ncbi:MAG: bifunctional enoyl-CoA hydratase/phosphate acetyltransferase [Alphaproteobacteria bacterium]|nr:MAG: bifunctional enoyl-CoA hydratase/phosphate acetyltransferase [Alphaproteobacteria bacterium]
MTGSHSVQCPPELLEAARGAGPLRTAVVSAGNAVVMESVRDAVEAGLIEPLLIGDPEDIKVHGAALGFDAERFTLDAAADEESAARKGAQHAAAGRVGAIMKGHVHTDVFMRVLLDKQYGLRTGRRLSHVFYMARPGDHAPLLITDGALNTHPDLETKKAILQNAVELAHALGITVPHVALLSATEEPSDAIPSSIEASRLCAWARDNLAGAEVEGPLAFDLAVSPEAARIKGVTAPVAGRADVILVPDIVSGNALFKMMVHFMGACAAGIVLGARVPILLTSRADPPAARLASAALAVIMDKASRGGPEAAA